MTTLEKQIYEIISKANGIKGSDIANALQLDKRTVNSTLSQSNALKAVVKQESDYKWYLISSGKGNSNAMPTPEPDEDLKKLCSYYLQCISLESSSSVSQFLESKYDKEYVVLNGLGIDAQRESDALSLLAKINANRDKKAYLGYPIRIYTIYGKGGIPYKKIAPVFLFHADYTNGIVDISWVPSINMDVLKGYCVGSSDTLANELVSLETELGMNEPDSDAEVDELVLRLSQIRDWEWAEPIDPYGIPRAQNLSRFADGIYNRPILISAEKGKYTDGLESELMTLATMPEENYRGTALYAWVKGISSGFSDSGIKPLLEVLPLNTEQAQAVDTALKSDLTIVTGPPGTGKSQVVTDLLANIAWNGKSALFSSRNNKAVDVVDVRVNALSKRPSLLRIGSNQYASRLAEIIENLLNASATPQDQTELEYLQQQYNTFVSREAGLKTQKDELVLKRNKLDEAEKTYCPVRDLIGDRLCSLTKSDIGQASKSARELYSAAQKSKKENNGFFARLFWGSTEPKRLAALETAKAQYNEIAQRYGLASVENASAIESAQTVLKSAEEFDRAVSVAIDYRGALESAHDLTRLEEIDRELLSIKQSRAVIAQKLWDKWLKANKVSISQEERRDMSNFVAAMKLTNNASLQENPELRKRYSKMIQLMTKYLQCWAVTSLSAKSRIPFEPHLFDYVIIDEASQCDIASIIPLLFRAKRAVIIGDPKQLQHISQLSSKQDLALLNKYHIDPMWSYSANSLYALAAGKVEQGSIIQLRDHFRSCADIIEFSNETFYDGSLRTATKYSALKTPPGEKPGIRWIDVAGKAVRPNSGSAFNAEEVEQIVKELRRLVRAGYKGSIGVTTPFHLQAERITQALQKDQTLLSELVRNHEFLADTVHKFQGDERDLMIFSCVVTDSAPAGTVGFLSSTGNLFNVAITRARSTLVVIGDYKYCSGCNIQYLRQFANYYAQLSRGTAKKTDAGTNRLTREYPDVSTPSMVSEWEKILYAKLYDAGIRTVPQYPADRYSLDLAILLPDGRKLDIEVDGEMYHRSWSGELCYRDQLRNQRLFELGWDVMRFWVFQIRDDMDWCVQRVQEWCNNKQ